MLDRLQIMDLEQEIGTLSGGQRKRLALAEVLLKPCDLLILDEPTNHLDIWMADWLEDFLIHWKKSLIMVTHDRYFLDNVSNRITELDRGKLYDYDAGYSGYLELKAQREEAAQTAERKRQSLLRKELAWVRRGARARTTKQKARLDRYEDLKNQKAPETDGQIEMSSVYTRMGKSTIEILNLNKSYDGVCLIHDFTYRFLKNDRVGFIGPNGCGKTTLMNMIAGIEKPDSGEIHIGQTIRIGYYSQEIRMERRPTSRTAADAAYMDPQQRVIDYIRDTAEFVRTQEGLISASSMLERFLFDTKEQYTCIENLSGGERRRLNLLRVLMEAPNVLLLDEPTNDLDVETLTVLEDYLDHFQGIVITVSHDRYFLDRIVNRIFAFEEGGVLQQYEGGYTDYRRKAGDRTEYHGQQAASAGQVEEKSAESGRKAYERAKAERNNVVKLSYQEKREYDTIEDTITELEDRIAQLDQQIQENASCYSKLRELSQEKESLETELEEKMNRWEYLEELAEKSEK